MIVVGWPLIQGRQVGVEWVGRSEEEGRHLVVGVEPGMGRSGEYQGRIDYWRGVDQSRPWP